jgi:hypothetical protein
MEPGFGMRTIQELCKREQNRKHSLHLVQNYDEEKRHTLDVFPCPSGPNERFFLCLSDHSRNELQPAKA